MRGAIIILSWLAICSYIIFVFFTLKYYTDWGVYEFINE